MFCRGTVPHCTSFATFPLESRCFVEEQCRTVPVVPLFLYALRGKVAQLVQYGTFPLTLRQSGERLTESRCFVEEQCRTVPVVPLFLYALRGKVAQLVQYGTFSLHHLLYPLTLVWHPRPSHSEI